MTSSSTGPGCCACSGPAGASRPCTSSPPRSCARPVRDRRLIVSPLLALMRNQIAAAERLGLRAHTINSTNREDWDEVRDWLARDAADLLLISPERLNNPQFRDEMLPAVRRLGWPARDRRGALHLGLGARLPSGLPARRGHARAVARGVAVLGTTATANDRVVADVCAQLAAGSEIAAFLPWAAGPGQPAPRGGRSAPARPAPRLAGHEPSRNCRGRGSSTR